MQVTTQKEKDTTSPPLSEKKAWVGAGWGALLGDFVGNILAAVTHSRAVGFLAFVASTAGGYFIGKSTGEKISQEERNRGKKQAQEPSFWNYKLGRGLAIGEAGAISIGLLLSRGGRLSGGTQKLLALLPIGGLISGGISGKEEMRQEYDHAKSIEASEQRKDRLALIEKLKSSPEPGMMVTPADIAILNATRGTTAAGFAQQEDMRRDPPVVQGNALT